jgi:hypothetical protein
MDQQTNKQEPSSTEGGQVKVGDKVWVLCEVKQALPDGFQVKGCSGGAPFWALAEDCRPVEPPNSPKILDSSSEPMREAFEAQMVKRYDPNREYLARNDDTRRYFDDNTEMAWQAFQAGSKYQLSPLTPSPCMDGVDADRFIEGVMETRGRTSDSVNPSHYKQGGIECIEAIKAATGDGFISYVWGNVLKYLWRWPKKGGVDDLKKARWYLDRLIKEAGE